MRSTVARLAGAALQRSDPVQTCVYYGLWASVPARFECYERDDSWIAVIPTNDELTIVASYFPQPAFGDIRQGARAAYVDSIRKAPALSERVLAGRLVERLRGSGDQRNFVRRAAGPGWALVGDAGVHKDSITARGITDAFVQADLLSRVGAVDLADADRQDAALREYAWRRDEAMAEPYRNALSLARLEVTDGRLAMLRAISESPTLCGLYFDVVAGLRRMDDLLVPELLARQ
jgi:flavin-dependent dehydrogenase